MNDAPDIVTVEHANTPFHAKVLAGVLADAGIPCYVSGQMLSDEFAMTQALMNLQRVAIQVPSERVEDAKRALSAAREAGKQLDDPHFDPGPDVDA